MSQYYTQYPLTAVDCFPSISSYFEQEQPVVDPKDLTCAFCKIVCTSKFALKNHKRECKVGKTFNCKLCDRKYTVHAAFMKHMEREHGGETGGEITATSSKHGTGKKEETSAESDQDNWMKGFMDRLGQFQASTKTAVPKADIQKPTAEVPVVQKPLPMPNLKESPQKVKFHSFEEPIPVEITEEVSTPDYSNFEEMEDSILIDLEAPEGLDSVQYVKYYEQVLDAISLKINPIVYNDTIYNIPFDD